MKGSKRVSYPSDTWLILIITSYPIALERCGLREAGGNAHASLLMHSVLQGQSQYGTSQSVFRAYCLYHGCANHATEGKCFCPPSTAVTSRTLPACSVANYVLHPCTLIACMRRRRGGQCFSVLRTRHTDAVGDSSGRSYVTEHGQSVPL